MALESIERMKKLLLIVLVIGYFENCYCQITTTKPVNEPEDSVQDVYDSTYNFPGERINLIVGQKLYLNGIRERLRQFEYKGFRKEISHYKGEDSRENTYKPSGNRTSDYEYLFGRYFNVLEVIRHPKGINPTSSTDKLLYADNYYLRLKEVESGDEIIYQYSSRFENSWNFIIVGFFEKRKDELKGQKFVFHDEFIESDLDLTRGSKIEPITGETWTVTDYMINEEDFKLSIVFSSTEASFLQDEWMFYNNLWVRDRIHSPSKVQALISKYGEEKVQIALKGSVKLGWNKELCSMAWGQPKEINEIINASGKSEQWVYKENYLYFDNDVLTTIQ